jgi:hypothetical protein
MARARLASAQRAEGAGCATAARAGSASMDFIVPPDIDDPDVELSKIYAGA